MNALIRHPTQPTTETPDAGLHHAPVMLTLPAEPAESACGWFESSWELRQGLHVSELPDSDLAVAALWFAGLAGSAGMARMASMPWQ